MEGLTLKKIVLWVLVIFGVLVLLAACSSPSVGISEVEKIPDEVQAVSDPDKRLQLIYSEEDMYYIVFHSAGAVEATAATIDTETSGDTINIDFQVSPEQDGEMNQYVYKLILDQKHEYINVQINGETVYFDESVV